MSVLDPGAIEQIRGSGLFDPKWYLESYPDVASLGMDPVEHYLWLGAKLGRHPSPRFDAKFYLEEHEDVAAAGMNPLMHYLLSGRDEGRAIRQVLKGGATAAVLTKNIPTPNAQDEQCILCLSNGSALPDLFSLRAAPIRTHRAVVAHVASEGDIERLKKALAPIAGDCELIVTQPVRLHVDAAAGLAPQGAKQAVVVFPDRIGAAQALLHLVNTGPLCDYDSVCWIDAANSRALADSAAAMPKVRSMRASRQAGLCSMAFAPIPEEQAKPVGDSLGTYLARVGCKKPPAIGDLPVGGAVIIAPILLHQLRAYGIHPDELGGGSDPALMLASILSVLCDEAGLARRAFDETPARANRAVAPTDSERQVKAIAFYLPQFHPIPENDLWWGRGFTEWTNVTKARPLFRSHHQPVMPADLGFYDLRSPDTQLAQAQLAHEYGVHGFCYYYYWFDGKKLLNRPIEQMLQSGNPYFPFCVCWANENWSRNWDGQNRHVLIEQSYTMESNRALIREFIKLMKDPRYIRCDGKPVLLVYRIRIIPNWLETAAMWREECRREGIGEIHLCAVRFGLEPLDGQPSEFGVDAFVLFPPHESARIDARAEVNDLAGDFNGTIFSYEAVVDGDLARFADGYPWPVHRGAMAGWDNTARRPRDSRLFLGATPARFHRWLKGVVGQELQHNPAAESLLFINAWNEWAEAATLEPSTRFGRGYLEAVRSALGEFVPKTARPAPPAKASPMRNGGLPSLAQWHDGDKGHIAGAPTVLVCAHVVSHHLFGGERSFIDMLDALAQLEMNLIVAQPSGAHKFYTELMQKRSVGVAVVPYRQWRKGREPEPEITAAFADLIGKLGVDAVYVNTIVLAEPLIAARKQNRIGVVHARELVDRDAALVEQIGLTPEAIIDQVLERTDFIIANSRATAALYHREDRTFCAPNAIDPSALDLSNDIGDVVNFAIVSNNLPKKGVADFIETARLCENRARNARFLVIGPENRHVDTWKADNPPANLTFAGYAETPAAAMAKANVILSLSHFAESFGRTVAEAQLARRPVIAYAHGAVTELIENSVTGFLTPPQNVGAVADAIVKLCRKPDLIKKMGAAGRVRIMKTYTPGALRDNLWRAFEKILNRKIVLRAEGVRRTTIVVPVFNAHDETRACLQSLEMALDFSRARVLVINDASTDPRMAALLAGYAERDGFDVITNANNVGYTGTINCGVRWAGDDDIVLLNSDAIVTPGFLEGLARAAYHGAAVGTATAMSDNAGAFSFPRHNEANPKPDDVSYEDHAAAILRRTSTCAPVEAPTGSGFCMYIRRDLFDAIGVFDEETFPRGYGEENDFCMRALRAGWTSVISPYAYVFHKRSASFGEEKERLIRGAVDKVTKRYPDYAPKVRAAFASPEMAALREAARDGFESRNDRASKSA